MPVNPANTYELLHTHARNQASAFLCQIYLITKAMVRPHTETLKQASDRLHVLLRPRKDLQAGLCLMNSGTAGGPDVLSGQ